MAVAERVATGLAEPKSVGVGVTMSSGAGGADEIFLSPRVIDRAAFESYSARLRELIDSVSAQRAELATTAAQAAETHKGLSELGGKNRESLDLATKLLRTLSQKTGDVESMLSRAEVIAQSAAKFEQEADRIIGARVSALEKRMAESMEGFARQLQSQVDAKAREFTKSLEELKVARESIKKQVDTNVVASVTALREACEKAELLVGHRAATTKDAAGRTPTAGSLGDLVRRASEAAERSEAALKGFNEIEQRADASVQRLSESLNGSIEFMDRAAKHKDALVESLQTALAASEEAQKNLTERATDAARIFKPISELRRNAEETAARLQALVNQAETAQSGGATITHELRELIGRTEAAADRLAPWRPVLLDGAGELDLPPAICELIDRIRAEVSTDLSKMAAAMNLIASRASQGGGASRRAPAPLVQIEAQGA
jgi:hypothetical protein